MFAYLVEVGVLLCVLDERVEVGPALSVSVGVGRAIEPELADGPD